MLVSKKHLALDDELIDALGVRELGGSLEEIKTSLPEWLLTGFMSQPVKTHWQAGFRLLRYLKATPDRGIFYAAGRTEDEEVYLRG